MAKLAGNSRISDGDMSQEIDLSQYIDGDIDAGVKRLFLQLAIEKINDRTLNGKELGGSKDFKPYSPEYAQRKGVSEDSVDLFLEGDMLDSLAGDTGDFNNDPTVTIYQDDTLEARKGYNHHVGATTKARPWFGLTDDEVREVASQVNSARPQRRTVEESDGGFTLADLEVALRQLGIEQGDN
jgi:hypothetical protein